MTVPIKFTNPLPEILRDLEIVKIGSTDSIHIFPEVKAKLDTCKEITIDYLNYFCSSEAALTMLYKNIHYPVKGTNARVVIGIVVTKTGKTAAFTKLEAPTEQEFVDVTLKTMNKIFMNANWIPGQVNGKPVNSLIVIPIEFVTR